MVHPVVEPSKGAPNPECHHPDLIYIQEGLLNDRLVKCARFPRVGPLLPKKSREPLPLPLVLSHIIDHHRPFILGSVHDPPYILKRGHRLQGPPAGLKIRSRACLSVLLYPPNEISLFALGVHLHGKVSPIQSLS